MFNVIVCESHPFCLKMLFFVWVTCRWSRIGVVSWGPFLGWVLGALIRNGMGTLLMFSIPCVLSLWSSWLWLTLGILWDVDEACVPETIYDIKWIPLQCFKYFNDYFYEGINCYLFIFEMFLRNVTLRCMWKLWFIYEILMLGKRGVTIGIRAGRSVRPSGRVLLCRVSVDILLYVMLIILCCVEK